MKNAIILLKSILALSIIVFVSCDNSAEPKNTAPVIQSVVVTPTTVNTNGTATVTVTATDAEANALTYSYAPNGGAIAGIGPFVNWTAPGTAGAYSVNVKVSDGALETEMTGNLTVIAPAVITQVQGVASFQAGVNSNLNNSQVGLYLSVNDWINYSPIKWVRITESGAVVNYTIANVVPGNYYLDIWKDNDNDGAWSVGDFAGMLTSGALNASGLIPFQIAEGQTMTFNISMFIL